MFSVIVLFPAVAFVTDEEHDVIFPELCDINDGRKPKMPRAKGQWLQTLREKQEEVGGVGEEGQGE